MLDRYLYMALNTCGVILVCALFLCGSVLVVYSTGVVLGVIAPYDPPGFSR